MRVEVMEMAKQEAQVQAGVKEMAKWRVVS